MNDEEVNLFGRKLNDFYDIMYQCASDSLRGEIEEQIPESISIVANTIHRAIDRHVRSAPAVVGALQEGEFDKVRKLASAHTESYIMLYTLLHAWHDLYYDVADENTEHFRVLHKEHLRLTI